MKAEIVAYKGEASVFAADTIDSLTHDDIVAASVRTASASSRRSARTCGRWRGKPARRARSGERNSVACSAPCDSCATGSRRWPRRTPSARTAGRKRRRRSPNSTAGHRFGDQFRYAGRAGRGAPVRGLSPQTWLTRPRPGIDRSGSAWLIRRFVDPAARFAFVDRPPASSKAIPFDMYDVEFSHHGDHCTFEVLADRFGIADQAVAQLGRLVHDLDSKDHRYSVPEAEAVGRLIDGLRRCFPETTNCSSTASWSPRPSTGRSPANPRRAGEPETAPGATQSERTIAHAPRGRRQEAALRTSPDTQPAPRVSCQHDAGHPSGGREPPPPRRRIPRALPLVPARGVLPRDDGRGIARSVCHPAIRSADAFRRAGAVKRWFSASSSETSAGC